MEASMRTLSIIIPLITLPLAAAELASAQERPAQERLTQERLAQERPARLEPTPAQRQAQPEATPIRKDPAEATGAITPRRIGQESERIVEGRRCSDVLQTPDQHPHALWLRCRAP
jgi:hypothetical protein